jgi:hypothetical protein
VKTTPILLAILTGLLLMSAPPAFAQIINIDSGSYTLYSSDNSTALLTGDLVQFGYYSDATTNNPFAGNFVALTSSGSSSATTVVGEETANGAGPGTFAYSSLNLDLASNALPTNGQIMAFVIYNNSTVGSSSAYAVEADLETTWNYSASAQFPVPQGFSLADTGTWEDNIAGYTGVPLNSGESTIPEPPSVVMLVLGSLVLAGWQGRHRIAFYLDRRIPPQ